VGDVKDAWIDPRIMSNPRNQARVYISITTKIKKKKKKQSAMPRVSGDFLLLLLMSLS